MSTVKKGYFKRDENMNGIPTLTKVNLFDAGLDICSSEDIIIPYKESKVVKTGIYIAVPEGCVGLLWSRSGLSVNHSIEVGAGCIDSGYRGEVKVHLYNFGNDDFKVTKGTRIAQLLTIPIVVANYQEVNVLDETDRGTKGFGSSGK